MKMSNVEVGDDPGRAISHGRAAFSGAMFIGTNYETLLGEMPVPSGLNPYLNHMYIGLPWVSTLASSQSALKAGQNALDARSRKQAQAQEPRQQQESEIVEALTAKKLTCQVRARIRPGLHTWHTAGTTGTEAMRLYSDSRGVSLSCPSKGNCRQNLQYLRLYFGVENI
jgi:hypothetical protein